MNEPIVSLCMPTNGVIEWVFKVLDSIYAQECDEREFEIVITDNGNNQTFKEKIKAYISNHRNIVYAETDALPFRNEIESYKRARGSLIKFVNHRTMLVEGALKKLIRFAKDNNDEKPITYFSNGRLSQIKKSKTFGSFDDFVQNLSYWSSWSTGMAIWKSDFEKLPLDTEKYNELFPHMNVLFAERNRGKYVIDNSIIFNELPVSGIPKAKYDLFYAFAVEYLYLILQLYRDGDITADTFAKVKKDNLYFIMEQYHAFVVRKQKCSYTLDNYKKCINVFYCNREAKSCYIYLRFNQIMRRLKEYLLVKKR